MSKAEKRILKFIHTNPGSSLSDLQQAFPKSTIWQLLGFLASLEDDNYVRCTQLADGDPFFHPTERQVSVPFIQRLDPRAFWQN